MNKSKSVLITFDYELFLGNNSGTLSRSILEPTEIILEKLTSYNATALFFVDSFYLLKLKEYSKKDFELIKDQIINVIKSGNDVGFHFHPQWIDTYPEDDSRWSFRRFDRYSFDSLSKEELITYFNDSYALLQDIVFTADREYKITSFRAGGWCIEPFIKIKDLFIKNGIEIDMSVLPGVKNITKYARFDFSNIDRENLFWRFENNPVTEKNGRFFEVAVTTFKIKKIFKTIDYLLFKKRERELGDGKAISLRNNNKKGKLFDKIVSLFKETPVTLSLDGISHYMFCTLLKIAERKGHNFFHTVGHPKKISFSFLKNLEYLLKNYKTVSLKEIKKKFEGEI